MEQKLKQIENYLQSIRTYPTVGNRYKLCGHRPRSIVLGVQRVCGGYRVGKYMKRLDTLTLWVVICEFMTTYFKDFKWNSVIINKNNQFGIHKDKNNKEGTQSMVIGLGEYEGGELNIYNEEQQILLSEDVRYRPFIYDLRNTYHSVSKFTGERYSMVFYTA